MRSATLILTLLLSTLSLPAQESLSDFISRTRGYYHYLHQSDIQNFSCLFTSGNYIEFINRMTSDTAYTYPLKLIWSRSGKIYYILQAFPDMNDTAKNPKVLEKIQLTKNQFHGFYLDWLNFLILSPVDDIPADADVRVKPDNIIISYTNQDQGITARVRKFFLPSGKLINVVVETEKDQVKSYPLYEEVDKKWLCYGWDTQIYENGQVTSGLSTRVEMNRQNNCWVPVRADLLVQTIDKPGERYFSVLFLKDYQFDLAIQELPYSEEKPDTLTPER